MARRHGWFTATLGISVTLVGCAPTFRDYCRKSVCEAPTSPPTLPVTQRGELVPEQDLSLLTSLPDAGDKARAPSIYRQLRARECQCLAAEASSLANLLNLEKEATDQKIAARKLSGEKVQEAGALQAQLLTYLALEDQNRSAARALDAYYRLGQAEADWDILQITLTQVTNALNKARDLKVKGVDFPADDTILYRQRSELKAKEAQLGLEIQQINSELRRLLGISLHNDEWHIWPVEAFRLVVEPVDLEGAKAVALAHRPDLLQLNVLQEELDAGNLDAFRQQIRAVNAALGQAGAGACPRLQKLVAELGDSSGKEAELAVRRRQLCVLRTQREGEVMEDVRQAARAVQAQANVVVLSQQRAVSWRGQFREAEEKEAKGVGSFMDTTNAKVEWLQGRQKVVEEITTLQRARVQFLKAQGILPTPPFRLNPRNCRITIAFGQ